ncbi:MAG: hypothetical protein HC932_05405 [Thermales bacterium]|nr:hypothetical protein [Thermales bacterium]
MAEEFPQSTITVFIGIVLGSLLTNLFGYVKGIFESKDKRIEAMQDQKLDKILVEIEGVKAKIEKQGKKTRKQINGLGNRLQTQLDDHEERITETERQLVSTK